MSWREGGWCRVFGEEDCALLWPGFYNQYISYLTFPVVQPINTHVQHNIEDSLPCAPPAESTGWGSVWCSHCAMYGASFWYLVASHHYYGTVS